MKIGNQNDARTDVHERRYPNPIESFAPESIIEIESK
jgi:hypothetical protein